MPEGVEMLYLYAFSLGRHSAAAMVHLLFTLLSPLGMLAFGKRMGSPLAGAVGGDSYLSAGSGYFDCFFLQLRLRFGHLCLHLLRLFH